MEHLYFFYFFLTFSIGVISLGIAYSTYIKTQEKTVKYYLYFYAAFSFSVVLNLFLAYFRINTEQFNPHFIQAIDYSEAFIAKYLLMFFIPFFIHHLFVVHQRRKKNIFFAMLIIFAFSIHHYFEFVTSSERIELIGDLIDRTIFFAILVYALILGIKKYKTIQEKIIKSMAKKMLILIAVMLPGLIHDIYLIDLWNFRFFPILYSGFSIIFSLHFIKNYLRNDLISVPDERIFENHNLSSREKEIVLLVLKGYSNQKIGKTLFISLNTVKSHIRHIFEKLNVKSRFELISRFKSP